MVGISEDKGYVIVGGLGLVLPHMEVRQCTAIDCLLAAFDAIYSYGPSEVSLPLDIKLGALLAHDVFPVCEDFHHQRECDFLTDFYFALIVDVGSSRIFISTHIDQSIWSLPPPSNNLKII